MLVTSACVAVVGAYATYGHKRVMVTHNSVCDKKCMSPCTFGKCENNVAKAKERAKRNRNAQLAGFHAPEDEQLVAQLKEGMEEQGMNV